MTVHPLGWDTPARKALLPVRREVNGLAMLLHPQDNWTEFKIWRDGAAPEPVSRARMVALVTGRRALVVDIGANCGTYTLALAAAAAPGSRVLAFEPNPVMAARLAANLALNGLQADLHRVALGTGEGTATLALHPENFGQATLRTVGETAGGMTVPVRPLAGFIPPGQFDIFVLKIDVEGYEDRILQPYFKSGVRLPDHILIEVEHAAHWVGDLPGDLAAAGYTQVFAGEGNALLQRMI